MIIFIFINLVVTQMKDKTISERLFISNAEFWAERWLGFLKRFSEATFDWEYFSCEMSERKL